MNVPHQAIRQLLQLAQALLDWRCEGSLLVNQLQLQFQPGEVLAQPVVKLARDAAPFGLLRAGQPPQHLPVRLLGPLALRDFCLQVPVNLRQLSGSFADPYFQLIALPLQLRFGPCMQQAHADGHYSIGNVTGQLGQQLLFVFREAIRFP